MSKFKTIFFVCIAMQVSTALTLIAVSTFRIDNMLSSLDLNKPQNVQIELRQVSD